jgi:glycine/D-amino acid oxidase-like deaminating enzyme
VSTLRSTFALATEPTTAADQLPERCLLWETARPYFYLRTTPDGRLIAGGEDTNFSNDHRSDRLLARKTRRLEKRLRSLFPDYELETACAWAGTFGESPDGLPIIGSPPEMPYAYFALGYGGNGITFSVLVARIITDLFRGQSNRDVAIFGFQRIAG